MPCRPRNEEKLVNQSANPAGCPSHSAMSQNDRGLGANNAAPIMASVASTASSRRSYAASSRTKARTSPASPGRTGLIETVMEISRYGGSHRDLGFDVRVRIVAFEDEILVAEREQVAGGGGKPHRRQIAW